MKARVIESFIQIFNFYAVTEKKNLEMSVVNILIVFAKEKTEFLLAQLKSIMPIIMGLFAAEYSRSWDFY